MVVVIAVALFCVLCIIYLVRDYYHNTERLTGRWYRRRKTSSVDYDIIVEFKINHQRFTKIATPEDLKVLKRKFNISDFKTLKNTQ